MTIFQRGEGGRPLRIKKQDREDAMDERISFQDITYPKEAAGWVDGVYYPRVSETHPGQRFLQRENGMLKLHSRAWQEIEETGYGIYFYEETAELSARLEGSNYAVKTTFANPGKSAYTCHIRVNGVVKADAITVEPGEEREVSFTACMTDGSFGLRFVTGARAELDSHAAEGDVYIKDLDITAEPAKERRDKPHLFLVSDSTVQSYEEKSYPQTGWGQVFYRFFKGAEDVLVYHPDQCDYSQAKNYELAEIVIENRAIAGRSARSFYDEGKLDQVLEVLCPGDFMLIQFAHNDDSKIRPNRYIAPEEFPLFLRRYAEACTRRGACCVFVTPVTMRRRDEKGRFMICFNPYRLKMMELAEKSGIPLLDLGKRSTDYLNEIGEEESRQIYLWAAEGEYPDGAYAAGVSDDAHLQEYGAMVYANLVARMIAEYDEDDKLDPLKRLVAPREICEIEKPRRFTAAFCKEGADTKDAETVSGLVVQEISVDQGRGSFLLHWNTVEGAVSYVVYARKKGMPKFEAVKTVTREEREAYAILPFNAEAGIVWEYCVSAVFADGREGKRGRAVEVNLLIF